MSTPQANKISRMIEITIPTLANEILFLVFLETKIYTMKDNVNNPMTTIIEIAIGLDKITGIGSSPFDASINKKRMLVLF